MGARKLIVYNRGKPEVLWEWGYHLGDSDRFREAFLISVLIQHTEAAGMLCCLAASSQRAS